MYLCDGHHITRDVAINFYAFILYLVLFSKAILYHYLKMKLKYSTRPLKKPPNAYISWYTPSTYALGGSLSSNILKFEIRYSKC